MSSRKQSMDRRTKSVSVIDEESNHCEDELIEQLRQKALSVNVPKYDINARVLCQHSDHMFYDAKIIGIKTDGEGRVVYTIHYTGWNSRYDEEIPHEAGKAKFIPFDNESAQLAKKAIHEARKQSKKKVEKKIEKKKPIGKKAKSVKASSTSSSKGETNEPSRSTTTEPKIPRKSESSEDEDMELFVQDLKKPFVESKRGSEVIGSRVLDIAFVDDNDLITRQMKVPKVPARHTVKSILSDYIEDLKKRDKDENWEAIHHDPGTVSKVRQDLHTIVKFFNNVLYQRLLYKVEIAVYVRTLLAFKNRENLLQESEFGVVNEEDVLDTVNAIKEAMRQKEMLVDMDDEADIESERRSGRIRKIEKRKLITKKKSGKVGSDEGVDEAYAMDCAEHFGFIHWIRFIYFFAKLIKSDLMKEIGIDRRVNLINDLIVFLSNNMDKYYDVNLDYEVPEPSLLREAFLH